MTAHPQRSTTRRKRKAVYTFLERPIRMMAFPNCVKLGTRTYGDTIQEKQKKFTPATVYARLRKPKKYEGEQLRELRKERGVGCQYTKARRRLTQSNAQ